MTQELSIDIWSDVMCPWCLVGWGGLQQALDQLDGEIDAQIRWHPFELNPDMPAEGEERTAHIARKYGRTLEQSRGVQDQMRDAAQRAGVSLDYEGEEPTPDAMMWNTFAALKLALFAAHFNQRRRIGEPEVLLDIAEEVEFDREAAKAALENRDYAEQVRAGERAAYRMNITGVPAMVVGGKFLIPGAQPAEAYVNALRRAAEKLKDDA